MAFNADTLFRLQDCLATDKTTPPVSAADFFRPQGLLTAEEVLALSPARPRAKIEAAAKANAPKPTA